MFSTSRAKPKKFCACLLTQRLPVSPGVCVRMTKGDLGARCWQSRVWRHAAIWPCTRPPVPPKRCLLHPNFFFLLLLLLCNSRRVLFSRSSRHHLFPSFFTCDLYQKVHDQVILPVSSPKEKAMICGLRELIIRALFFLSAFRTFWQYDQIEDKSLLWVLEETSKSLWAKGGKFGRGIFHKEKSSVSVVHTFCFGIVLVIIWYL